MASIDRLTAADAVARIVAHDPSLWSDDNATQDSIADRLGWTHLATLDGPSVAEASALARSLAADGITDIALLGMGGSSLAGLTMASVFESVATGARLHVLDTTSPHTISRVMEELDPATTAFFVSSKSGSTVEPNTLYAIFRAWAEEALGADAGSHFIAITDPGSSLATLAAHGGFRTTLLAPPDVGGRYSALTPFGLAPAACVGVDLGEMLARASRMQGLCQLPAADNPAAQLAAFIADGHAVRRDKLSIVTSPSLAAFSLWVEQLVAESTGKNGTGIVPVPELAAHAPNGYGDDRVIVVLRYPDDHELAEWTLAQRGERPVFEIVCDDAYDIGAEFVRWEYATAMLGFLLGVNPFDEPNVAEAKAATVDVLEGGLAIPAPDATVNGARVVFGGGIAHRDACDSLADVLEAAIGALGDRHYLAILAYLPDDEGPLAPLRRVVPQVASTTGHAVALELGPRYLHSTGQLHKGGPAEGVFVIVTTRSLPEVPVPGSTRSLGELFRAQATGDFLTLDSHGRPVVWIELPDASTASISELASSLAGDALLGV